jgi:hypothetical protein
MRTKQPVSLFESLEGRAMFNAAPVIPDWIDASKALTRWTAGPTSWSYEEIAAQTGVADADGDDIRFFVRAINKIPAEFGPGLLTNGGIELVRGAKISDLADNSPNFLDPGESISLDPIYLPLKSFTATIPIVVYAYDGKTTSTSSVLLCIFEGPENLSGLVWGIGGSNSGPGGGSGSGSGGSDDVDIPDIGPLDLGSTPPDAKPAFETTYTASLDSTTRTYTASGFALLLYSLPNPQALSTARVYVNTLSAGVMKINGSFAKPGQLIDRNDSVTWTTTDQKQLVDGFQLKIADLHGDFGLSNFRFLQDNWWDGQGPFDLPDSRKVSAAISDAGVETRAWRNSQNELVVRIQPRGGSPVFYDLSDQLRLLNMVADPVAFRSTLTGQVEIAISEENKGFGWITLSSTSGKAAVRWAADEGVVGAAGRFTTLLDMNLGTETRRSMIVAQNETEGSVFLFTDTGRYLGARLVGTTLGGLNVLQTLKDQDIDVPAWVGRISAYRTPWGGVNIAGLNTAGNLQVAWTPSADLTFAIADLTRISSGPKLVGTVSAFIAPWNGIHLAGQTADGSVIVTWWAPALGGEWRSSNFSTDFDGTKFQPGSLSTYTTSWNALNVVGMDQQGRLRVFWWTPSKAADNRGRQWSLDTLAADGMSPSTSITAVSDPGTSRITLLGQAESKRKPRALTWTPDDAGVWQFEQV